MMKQRLPQPGSQQQAGFLLLGVLFMILLILFALAVAAPKMAQQIRRDKEEETIQRGKQYARAIRVFYTKYGRYPNTIDQLMHTDNQRFLRKRYLDPMTGKDDWRIIHLGEAKVPTMGLFGQPVQQNGITPTGATTTGASTTSSSSLGSSNSSFGGSGTSFGSSGFGSSGSSNSPFGSSGSSNSPFGNSGSSNSPIGGTTSGSGINFGSSTGSGGTTATGANGATTGTGTTGSSSAFGSPGATFGGAPIVGVGLPLKKTSIKVYRKQTQYNMWEFVFDPNQITTAGGAPANLNASNGTSGSGLNSGTGSSSSFSNSNGFGSSSGTGFGSSNGTGFGSSNGNGFGSSNGNGFGGSPANPVSPTSPVTNPPQ